MELLHNIMLALAAIAFLIFLRRAMKRSSRDNNIEDVYRKILISDEHKVKGRFEE